MGSRWYRWVSLGVGLLIGCTDTSTGRLVDPDGPLEVLRLTLFDRRGRDAAVFSDTSIPPDCSAPEVSALPVCYNEPLGDMYGARRSPPTPDSGEEMRVVFNKPPLLLGGAAIAPANAPPELTDPTAVTLTCTDCSGLPPLGRRLDITGSHLSYDPLIVPYGPALILSVKPGGMQPLGALEPASTYQVHLDPRLSGRDGQAVRLDAPAEALLRFTTEPLRVLQAGIGDAKDPWVYKTAGAGVDRPFSINALPQDGVLVLRLNAPLDESLLTDTTVTATVDGQAVPARAVPYQLIKNAQMKIVCEPGKRRFLYLMPALAERTWPLGTELLVTVRGADVRDLSQAPGHPAGAGRHGLSADLTFRATLSGAKADTKSYKGLTTDRVSALAECAGRS